MGLGGAFPKLFDGSWLLEPPPLKQKAPGPATTPPADAGDCLPEPGANSSSVVLGSLNSVSAGPCLIYHKRYPSFKSQEKHYPRSVTANQPLVRLLVRQDLIGDIIADGQVTAVIGSLVRPLGQDSPHRKNCRRSVREYAHHTALRLVPFPPLRGLVNRSLCQCATGKSVWAGVPEPPSFRMTAT